MKGHNRNRVRNELFLALIGAGILIPVVIIGSQLQVTEEVAGVQGIYGTIEEFNPFTELALVKSTAIKCSGTDSIYITTDTDSQRQLNKVGFEDEIIPSISLSLINNIGKTVKSFEGEVKIKCDKITSPIINPHFVGGTLYLSIYATNADGKTIKIKEQQLAVSSTPVSANGITVTIAKWTLKPEEIESKLSNSNFKSTVTTTVVGSLKFKTFANEKQTWTYQIRDGFPTAYTFTVNKGPDIGIFEGIDVSQRKVELKLVNPLDGKVNLAKVNRVNLLGSLYDWEEKEGLPLVRVYYNDEKAAPSEKTTPLFQKTLTEKKGSTGKGKVMDFPITIPVLQTAKLGEYKVVFSSAESNGSPIRKTVGTMAFYVINQPDKPAEDKSNVIPGENNLTPEEKDNTSQVCQELAGTEKDPQQYIAVIDRLATGKARDLLTSAVANNQIFDICKIGSGLDDLVEIGTGFIPLAIGIIVFLVILAIIVAMVKASRSKPRYPPGY